MKQLFHIKKRVVILSLLMTLVASNSFGWSFKKKLEPEYWNNHIELKSSTSSALTTVPKISSFKSLDGLKPSLLEKGLQGYVYATEHGKVRKPYLVIVNYEITSDKPRLWIFDLRSHQLIAHLRVAHGSRSGAFKATKFSNKIDTRMSSLGVFTTGGTYYGHFGYSLKLHGLEKGINDSAYRRHVVIHSGDYVGDKAVRKHGQAGKAWGCLVLNPTYSNRVINLLKGGSVIDSFRS